MEALAGCSLLNAHVGAGPHIASAQEATHHRAVFTWRKGHLLFTQTPSAPHHVLLEHSMYPSPTSNSLTLLTVRAVDHGMGSTWEPVRNAAPQAPPQA